MDKIDNQSSPADAARFDVRPMTLAVDRWMGRLIRFGGIGVVLAVFGMLAFLIFQIFPLFAGAKVQSVEPLLFPAGAVAFGEDEYGEVPFVCLADGTLHFQDSRTGAKVLQWSPNVAPARSPRSVLPARWSGPARALGWRGSRGSRVVSFGLRCLRYPSFRARGQRGGAVDGRGRRCALPRCLGGEE